MGERLHLGTAENLIETISVFVSTCPASNQDYNVCQEAILSDILEIQNPSDTFRRTKDLLLGHPKEGLYNSAEQKNSL